LIYIISSNEVKSQYIVVWKKTSGGWLCIMW